MTIENEAQSAIPEGQPAKPDPLLTRADGQPVRLASIVAVDVAGFSTMSERDQQATAAKIEALRRRIEAIATRHEGRIFNTAGDGFMLEFKSAGAAVGAIDHLINRKPKGEPAIRIGAHVGDVVVTINNDLLGHGVNVAARLQSLAAPNTALVSGEFRSMARTSPTAAFKAKGRQPLENINQRVATFAILSKRQRAARAMARGAWVLAGAAAVAGGIFVAPTAIEYAKEHDLLAFMSPPAQVADAGTPPATPVTAPAPTPAPPVALEAVAPASVAEGLAKPAETPAGPEPAAPPPEVRPTPGQTMRDCETCPELIVIPGGTFMMGSPAIEADRFANEGPQREVTVPLIAIGKYEVTFAEWDACLAAGGCNGFSPQDKSWGRGRRPVMGVSWADAQSYIAWLNQKAGLKVYRLPTEAEWEYAARGGTKTRFSFGDKIARAQANFGSGRSDPVGSYLANGFGLFDMHGNVWEWTADCYKPGYKDAPVDGSAVDDPACKQRVYRGGGYDDPAAAQRAANRRRADPALRAVGVGFRVVRDAS